ncbi:protein translocase subunit SecD [Leucothrix pacifica]|uniref:Protein translocase subunit SecD n=1 Tax=Leucothrix pacifica TaxID=1247513 RepID=A0A317CKF2_9GAMM|nr:protein translocase subunit SecD [Leucothrix pacifica]PWQ99075.1 protein translocase subunit SecD [Leucothrix pacifica]
MNQNPTWKYLLLVAVCVIGMVYALPNLYPSNPALQISLTNTDQRFVGTEIETITKSLNDAGIDIKKVENKDNKLMVHFADTDAQFAAVDPVKASLGDQYAVALNLAPTTPSWLSGAGAKPMYLGLDLRGGVHFLMEVDMEAALNKGVERYKEEIRGYLVDEKLKYLGVIREADDSLTIKFKDQAALDAASKKLTRQYQNQLSIEQVDATKGASLRAAITEDNLSNIKKLALQQNITTLRNRVNEIGVAEPIIQQQGLERIVVQLPGVQDPSEAKKILGATATLEFRMVDEENNAFDAQANKRTPIGSVLYEERGGSPILLKRQVMLTGDFITDASATFDQNNQPAVSITLDGKGARMFERATGANVQKLMGVVFIESKTDVSRDADGNIVKKTVNKQEVINVARIQEQLSSNFQITGLDSPKEAHDLALLLRAGALAAPVYIVEERTVGPSLGADNIEAGFNSVIYGLIAVLIFMLIYYRVFGIVANLALSLNLILIVAVLSLLQATLTLPGIAGIVLTVGMAVDANVLIYERIKEEIRAGMSPQNAIHSGYEKAFSTITDANITTFIAAIVLYGMGTGPIKGFAITLAIGILSSMFTAIFGTRVIVNMIYGNRRVEKLNIG